MLQNMSQQPFRVTDAEIRAGYNEVGEGFEDGRYAYLAEAALEAKRGDMNAIDVVGVQYIIDLTLATLGPFNVANRLPSEVRDRTSDVYNFTKWIGASAVASGQLQRLYLVIPPLREAITRDDFNILGQSRYFGTLGAAAFLEVGAVGGGAHRLLTNLGVPSTNEVIQRSTGLLQSTKVKGRRLPQLLGRLGNPYIDPQNLRHRNGEVIYSKNARQIIATLSQDTPGCPAAKVPGRNDTEGTILSQSWAEMVSLLISEEATTHSQEPFVFKESDA